MLATPTRIYKILLPREIAGPPLPIYANDFFLENEQLHFGINKIRKERRSLIRKQLKTKIQ